MAINKKLTTAELIKIFIENSINLKNYESSERILNNEKHSYNTAKKISRDRKSVV